MVRPALGKARLSFLKSNNGSSNPPSEPMSTNTSPKQGPVDSGLVLRANVIRARNLAAKDRSGTSDPYLVLTLGDSRQATSVISKTLNPEWNQTFELPIIGIQSLLLEIVLWDKDRFGKDYLGEFDVALEDIFSSGGVFQEQWYPLESRKPGKKKSVVTGEVLMQLSLVDPSDSSASAQQVLHKFANFTAVSPEGEDEFSLDRADTGDLDEEENDDTSDETDDKPTETAEKKKRRMRIAKLRRKATRRAYEFSGSSDVAGVLFLEVTKITDLPPERNMTRTSFDMDPFVVTSLGKKTYRTRVVRHNLNPVFEEKLVFQVMRHEVNYFVNFAVVDRDKLSGNDFVGTTSLPLEKLIQAGPDIDLTTGLYTLPEPPDPASPPPPETRRSRFRLPMSRSSSATSLSRIARPGLKQENSSNSLSNMQSGERTPPPLGPTSAPSFSPTLTSQESFGSQASNNNHGSQSNSSQTTVPQISVDSSVTEDGDLKSHHLRIDLKNKDRWETKHSPTLYIKARYLPYQALRQQFWRAILKQYDADDSGKIDRVELTTMLDSLGSTLHTSTIDSFFKRFATENHGEEHLTFDQAVICLEDQLQQTTHHKHWRGFRPVPGLATPSGETSGTPSLYSGTSTPLNNRSELSVIPAIEQDYLGHEGEEGDNLEKDDLADEKGEEHVIEIRECPICHQPRLNKRTDADIITHVATCASQDWRQVNNVIMAGFVTSSQAQRKWYSKVVTKISYGGYKLGANSANILVQDRLTGQINEERMSVYVRLGIRLLYKGLKSRDMERKKIRKLLKSLSIKQGKKYDDPASASQIESFIAFHQLDMSEVLFPVSDFKNFNEFFYRALKPEARPCSAPDNPNIITSPADCRSVVFNTISVAQSIWIKGREFTIERLLGNAYPEDAKRYQNGALGIFRLAPQDYHRFHICVDGTMGEPKLIDGEYYTVNPMAIRSALDVYGENVRVIVPIDSVKHGRVMVICVGAMMVGSTVITRKPGDKVSRAEELGYFKFGGSTILLLFEPGVMQFDDDLVDNSSSALETLIRVGMSIGHSPDTVPHTPDMRKSDPTHEEKQEAKRRIEGSLAPDASTQAPL